MVLNSVASVSAGSDARRGALGQVFSTTLCVTDTSVCVWGDLRSLGDTAAALTSPPHTAAKITAVYV